MFVRLKPKLDLKERDSLQVVSEKTIKVDENYYSFDRIFN